MKKKRNLLIAAILIASSAALFAGMSMKCGFCNGTGWNGQFKCVHCGGDGDLGN